MGETTGISWTDHTFSAWWGCTHVGNSPACFEDGGERCYAETWANRMGHNVWGADAPRRFFGETHWQEPIRWNRKAQQAGIRRRVFCMSMGDWAEGRPDQKDSLVRLWSLIPNTPWLDWLMLTKRPQLIPKLYPEQWQRNPLENVWMGVTAENQYWMDIRWPQLRRVQAVVHWFSIEPLFGPMIMPRDFLARGDRAWSIIGGQSGPKSKPMHADWYRSVRDQCVAADSRFFMKQHGEWIHDSQIRDLPPHLYERAWKSNPKTFRHEDGTQSIWLGKANTGHLIDGREWHEFPLGRTAAAPEPVQFSIL